VKLKHILKRTAACTPAWATLTGKAVCVPSGAVRASEDAGNPSYLLLYPQSSVEVGTKVCRKVSNVTSDTLVYMPLRAAWTSFIAGGYPTVSISLCGI
jgi:hypothetical protein